MNHLPMELKAIFVWLERISTWIRRPAAVALQRNAKNEIQVSISYEKQQFRSSATNVSMPCNVQHSFTVSVRFLSACSTAVPFEKIYTFGGFHFRTPCVKLTFCRTTLFFLVFLSQWKYIFKTLSQFFVQDFVELWGECFEDLEKFSKAAPMGEHTVNFWNFLKFTGGQFQISDISVKLIRMSP